MKIDIHDENMQLILHNHNRQYFKIYIKKQSQTCNLTTILSMTYLRLGFLYLSSNLLSVAVLLQ